jgi:hypothetical protein
MKLIELSLVTRGLDPQNAVSECVPIRSDHLSGVMPAQRHPAALRGGDPVFAGIHVFLPRFQLKDVDGRDEPGHDSE